VSAEHIGPKPDPTRKSLDFNSLDSAELGSTHLAQRPAVTDTLADAAARGDIHAVRTLLRSGLSADARGAEGRTPLMWAAMGTHLDIIDALLEAGADVNAHAIDGSTALTTATLWNQPEAVRRLLARGANPDITDADGWTPIAIAQARGYADITELLRLNKDLR
jgi:ankyrin repeat protein